MENTIFRLVQPCVQSQIYYMKSEAALENKFKQMFK